MPPQSPAVFQQAPPSGFWANAYSTLRNSALGYAVESSMPGLADAIGMHPSQTVYSPDYQAARNNAINPQFLVPATSAYHNRALATARGALGSAASMTSGPSIAMLGGLLATGGLSGAAGLAANAGLIGNGIYGLGKQAYQGLGINNANPESYEHLGNFLFNAGQVGLGARGLSKGLDAGLAQRQAELFSQRESNMVYRAQPLANAGEGVRDFNSHAQATNDPAQALRYKSDLENQTGRPHEVVRINRNMLPQDSYETAPHPSGAEWTKFKGDVPEHAIDRTPTPVDLAQQIYDAHQKNGGATFSGSGQNLVGTSNYAVSMFPDLGEVHGQDFGASHIQNFMQRPEVQAQLARGGAVGTWHDQSSGQHYLDVSATTSDRNLATQLGRQYNQKAIFDLNGLKEISTGGTGETIPNLPPVNQRMDALQPSFWQGTANAIQRNPMLRPILGTSIAPGFAAPLTVGDALGMPADTGFDPEKFGSQEPGPSNLLAPFGTTAAKRFSSVVPDSVAQHLTPGWENILKSPVSQKGMLDYRKQIASPEEVQASAQLSQSSGFNWYPMSRQLGPTFEDAGVLPEGVNANHFNGVLAATSPRNPVSRNLAETLDVMNNVKQAQRGVNGDPLNDQEAFKDWLAQGAEYDGRGQMSQIHLPYGGRIDVAGAKFNNMGRAMFNEPLGGLKASSFWGDLNQGNFGTMDTISQKGLGAGELFPGKMGTIFRPAQFMGARSRMSEVAQEHGVSVDQIQAPQWVTSKIINDSQALQTAKPQDVIDHINNQMATGMPSTDFASIALDALEGKHQNDPRYSAWKKDYSRIDDLLRQLHDNNEGKLNDFKANLNERVKPLREERSTRPLGEPASKPLRKAISRTQRSIVAAGAADEE